MPLAEGIYTIDEMRDIGKQKNWCPYFVTRHVLSFANVVVYNYQVNNMLSSHTPYPFVYMHFWFIGSCHRRARSRSSTIKPTYLSMVCNLSIQ